MERNPKVLAEMVQEVPSISAETKEELLGYIERVTGHASMRSQGITVDYYMMPKMNVAKAEAAVILSRRNQPTQMTVVNEPQVRPANAPASTAMPTPSVSKSSMPTPSLAALKSSSAKTSGTKSSGGESMPFPSAADKKSTVAKSESKSDLPAIGGQSEAEVEKELNSVLSEGESLEEFSLNDDSQELVFSDDFSSSEPKESADEPTNAEPKADESAGGELSFDFEYDDSSDDASSQTISVAKPIAEAPAADAKEETDENDGWNAVITSTVSSQTASAPAMTAAPGGGQKCSWKKPDVR